MKILFSGGGTAGSVSPLLAIYSTLLRPSFAEAKEGFGGQGLQRIKNGLKGSDVLWLGTKKGPEKKMVADYGIKFRSIQSGKLRRYFDLRNVVDVFKIKIAFWQAIFIILKFKPDIILSAGSFVSVPVIWAGWLFSKKSLIHQQDVRPGLANRLMAPFATRITVTFEESLAHFSKKKTVWTGNPVREEILAGDKEQAIKRFDLEPGVPTLLVMGGGTGSATINRVIEESIDELSKFCQVVHLTGSRNTKHVICSTKHKDKVVNVNNVNNVNKIVNKVNNNEREKMINDKCQMINPGRYHQINFLNVREMADVYAVADVVVSRCGMSSLTELSALAKPVIFIPLADTHQEDNAKMILAKEAGKVIWQRELNGERLVGEVKNALDKKKIYEDNINGLIKDGKFAITAEIEKIGRGELC